MTAAPLLAQLAALRASDAARDAAELIEKDRPNEARSLIDEARRHLDVAEKHLQAETGT